MSFTNPQIDTTIKNLGIGSLIMQILLFVLRMVLLEHTRTYIENTAAHGWAYRGSVITTSVVKAILREMSMSARCQNFHSSAGRMSGENNKMSDAAS